MRFSERNSFDELKLGDFAAGTRGLRQKEGLARFSIMGDEAAGAPVGMRA